MTHKGESDRQAKVLSSFGGRAGGDAASTPTKRKNLWGRSGLTPPAEGFTDSFLRFRAHMKDRLHRAIMQSQRL
jgi:hypothetical protein